MDVWSCGITLYMLFTMGKHPIYQGHETKEQYLEKFKGNIKWNFPSNMS